MNQKLSTKQGMIILEIILTLSLAVLFIYIISDITFVSRNVFDRARERNILFDLFDENASTTSIILKYGNERLKYNYETKTFGSTTDEYHQSLKFTSIFSSPHQNLFDFAGTPLCSADFTGKVIGADVYQIGYGNNNLKSSDIVITPIILPLSPLLPLTDFEIRNDMAYISSDSPIQSDPDLLVVNIKDKNNPILMTSINTGPGINSFKIFGKIIMAGATSLTSQIHGIKIERPDFLHILNKYKLNLPYATATPPYASSIFYKKGFIYFGTEKWDGNEFIVIDVSNPQNPIEVSGLEIGSKINDIFINDNKAYLASSGEKQILVVDISDLSNLHEIYSFNLSGWQRQEGKSLSVFEEGLLFGRTVGGFNIEKDHELFSWLSNIIFDSKTSLDIPGGVYGIISDKNYHFVITREMNKELQIFDKTLAKSSINFSLPIVPQAITCDGNYIYILASNAPVIYKINFQENE